MKPLFRIDPRWIILITALFPAALLLFNILFAIFTFPPESISTTALIFLIFVLLFLYSKVVNNMNDRICKFLLVSPTNAIMKGKYLFFTIEDIDTFTKLKIIQDDFGIITFENGIYTICTLNSKYEIESKNIDLEIYEKGKLATGVKIIFTPVNTGDKITILGQFIYRGFNSRIAKSELNKSMWAKDCILNWSI